MKEIKEIKNRLAQLEDEILYTNAGKYQNFYKASNLENEAMIKGAFLALSWALDDD